MVYIIRLIPHLNQNHTNFTIGTLDSLVEMMPESLDILWVFVKTCSYKKYFKIQSSGGAPYSQFLTTFGDPALFPTTTTDGTYSGGFQSTCNITDTFIFMLCKKQIKTKAFLKYTVWPCTRSSGSFLVSQHRTADIRLTLDRTVPLVLVPVDPLNQYIWQSYRYMRSKHIRTSSMYVVRHTYLKYVFTCKYDE